jgi:uncharacterized protein with HEPN domain
VSYRVDPAYLEDIFLAARKIRLYTTGMTKTTFTADSRTQDAVLRQLSVIGEAAASISAEFQKAVEGVQWRGVVAFRNLVVHQYWQVDLDRVWGIVKKDLPELVRTLKLAGAGRR